VGGTEPVVTYNNSGTVEDLLGNMAAAFDVTLADAADPVLVEFAADPDPSKIGDALTFDLTFSEEMNTGVALSLVPTNTKFDNDASAPDYNVTVNTYSGNLWEGDYDNGVDNVIVVGTPPSGTHTFTSTWDAEDPTGNIMAIVNPMPTGFLDFVIDSVVPETSGLEATPSVTPLNSPVVVTATVNDDLAPAGAKLYIEGDNTTVLLGAMTESQTSNGGLTKTYQKTIVLSDISGISFTAGQSYNIFVRGIDAAGNAGHRGKIPTASKNYFLRRMESGSEEICLPVWYSPDSHANIS